MFKKLLLIVCLMLPMTGYCKTQAEVIENAKKFTVLVTQEGLLATRFRGSGVLLDERHVLTCFHLLVSPQDELFVYTYPLGKVYVARPDVVDTKNDLAILVLDSSATVHVKPVIQSKYTIGETVYTVGNSLGSMNWRISKGIITGKERSFLMTDAMGQHGDSGGPWINEKGEILALTSWGFDEAPGMEGGIAGKEIYTFVDYYFHPEKLMKKFLEALFGVSLSTATKHK